MTLNSSISYTDTLVTGAPATPLMQVANLYVNIATKRYVQLEMSVLTAEQALNLGNLNNLGWAFFFNADTTNFIELRAATGGIKFAKMLPGEFAHFRFGSGITAPYVIADTAACQMFYLLVNL